MVSRMFQNRMAEEYENCMFPFKDSLCVVKNAVTIVDGYVDGWWVERKILNVAVQYIDIYSSFLILTLTFNFYVFILNTQLFKSDL